MKLSGEFALRNFRLDCGTEWDFAGTQWRRVSPLTLLTYRLVVTVYCMVLSILSILSKEDREKWLLFLTSFNYVAVMLYFGVGSWVIIDFVRENQGKQMGIPMNKTLSEVSMKVDFYHRGSNENIGNVTLPNCVSGSDVLANRRHLLPKLYRTFWLLFNVSLNSCTLVVIGYWTVIYNHSKDADKDMMHWYLRVDRHGINLLFLLIDFMISRTPVRILHFVYPSLFLVCYIVLNSTYWLITDDVIYPALDYGKNPRAAAGFCSVSVLIVSPIIQFVYYLAFRLKKHVAALAKARNTLRLDSSSV